MIWWAYTLLERALVVTATTVGIALVLAAYWAVCAVDARRGA